MNVNCIVLLLLLRFSVLKYLFWMNILLYIYILYIISLDPIERAQSIALECKDLANVTFRGFQRCANVRVWIVVWVNIFWLAGWLAGFSYSMVNMHTGCYMQMYIFKFKVSSQYFIFQDVNKLKKKVSYLKQFSTQSLGELL